jgi:hypothetical protein
VNIVVTFQLSTADLRSADSWLSCAMEETQHRDAVEAEGAQGGIKADGFIKYISYNPLTISKSPSRLKTVLILFVCYISYYSLRSFGQTHLSTPALLGNFKTESPRWAYYTPYSPTRPYTEPPATCTITQINILQRHGARYPDNKLDKRMRNALSKIQKASTFKDNRMKFIGDFEYKLGAEDLVEFGADE